MLMLSDLEADGTPRIAAIIPCYRVRRHILNVLAAIGPEVARVYCVDDACPDESGRLVEAECRDPRVSVIYHDVNRGVGGAVMSGYRQAIADDCTILVKIDGDGQMDPALVPEIAWPIIVGVADYSKGNRFYNIEHVKGMPIVRLMGNGMLSFLTKLSSGYWNIFDPTNGYTAIHRSTADAIVHRRIDSRYFFETDMLLHLYLLRAVVYDVPMGSVYKDEQSNLRVRRVALPFLLKNIRNFLRRVFIHYFIRDFSLATVEAVFGLLLLTFGTLFGAIAWAHSVTSGEAATAGQVMIAALPILGGLQLMLSALNFDMRNVPTVPRLRWPHLRARGGRLTSREQPDHAG